MTMVQITAATFGLIMMYLTFLHYKRKEFSSFQFVVWQVLWIGFLVVVILPGRFDGLTQRLGITRAFDLFSIIAFVVILALTFHNYLLIAKLEKRLEQRVRENALNQLKQLNDKP